MTFTTALRAWRAAWLFLIAAAVLGALAGLTVSALTAPSYTARTSVYLTGADAIQEPGADVYSSSVLSNQRVASYKELLVSSSVLGPATTRAGVTPAGSEVTASGTTGSTLIQITATASDPGGAARLADAVAVRLGEVVTEIDRPRGPQGLPAVRVNVVAPAAPPSEPVRPETMLNVAVGAAVGLLAVAALVLARRALDATIRSSSELARRTGRPILGVVPETSSPGAAGAEAEAAREVRTRLQLSGAELSALALTGAVPGVGTTTLATSLAGAFARRARVLLLDADLRLPGVARTLGLDHGPGLGEVLAGTASLDAVVRRQGDLDVLVAGVADDDTSDLLSWALPALLDALRERYDLILVDGPPVLDGLDASVLARQVDATVLVCADGMTTTKELDAAMEALDGVGARLAGSVLTRSREGVRQRRGGPHRAQGGRTVPEQPPARTNDTASAATDRDRPSMARR